MNNFAPNLKSPEIRINKPLSAKRIAIVGRLDEPGGVQSVIVSLIRGLNSVGVEPDLIWDTPPNKSLLQSKGVHTGFQYVHLPVSTKLLYQIPVTIRYILRTADTFSTKKIYHPYDFYYIFYNGFLVEDGTPHIRYLSGPPLLPQLDSVSPGLRGIPYRVLRSLYRNLLSKRFPVYDYHRDSNYVINSEYTASLFEEAHGVRLPVVHPPIDLTGRNFVPNDLDQRDTVAYFSRFARYKRPQMVLALAARHPEMRFILMGGVRKLQQPFVESLHEQARAQGLQNVEFIENPSNARVKEELARTRFYVFPAVNEHFGMATAEAIGSGAIPFVHDSGGQREVVPDPRLRFTDEKFVNQFDELLQLSNAQLASLQIQLRQHVDQFSEEAFIKKMIKFIETPTESEQVNGRQ